MKSILLTLTVLISTLVFSPSSLALGKLGHQVVCQLAYDHLSTEQQAKLNALLAIIPENHQALINHYNYNKQGTAITFATACTWADAIKRIEEFKVYSSWHYMNVPRDQQHISADACDKNCLPQAILQHQQQLMAKQPQATWQQTQALLFLGHWLGDIHQPLHVSYASDLGGNKVKLSHLNSKCSNLHWFWDECILSLGKQSKSQWLQRLSTHWQDSTTPSWQGEQVWQWADESLQLIKHPNFHYCQMDSTNRCQQPTEKIALPDNYLTEYQVVIEQRLLLAAQRLKHLLAASL